MIQLVYCLLGIAFGTFWFWLMVSRSAHSAGVLPSQDDMIDPNNSYQLGYLIGMTGGTVTDGAVARYALQRFEELYGYKPTLRDAAIVVGLMNGMPSLNAESGIDS